MVESVAEEVLAERHVAMVNAQLSQNGCGNVLLRAVNGHHFGAFYHAACPDKGHMKAPCLKAVSIARPRAKVVGDDDYKRLVPASGGFQVTNKTAKTGIGVRKGRQRVRVSLMSVSR